MTVFVINSMDPMEKAIPALPEMIQEIRMVSSVPRHRQEIAFTILRVGLSLVPSFPDAVLDLQYS